MLPSEIHVRVLGHGPQDFVLKEKEAEETKQEGRGKTENINTKIWEEARRKKDEGDGMLELGSRKKTSG